jgi:hypothetical protein
MTTARTGTTKARQKALLVGRARDAGPGKKPWHVRALPPS